MQLRPYSVNFDESTINGKSELTLNVAFLTQDLLVERRCLAVIDVEEGTTGEEMANTVMKELVDNQIPLKMMMSVKTDGCSAMIGHLRGAQKFMREKVPTLLPNGGCVDHDLANVLKSAVQALCPELTSIYPAMHACLAKHSMDKKRKFEALEEEVGEAIRKVPKFINVRFRIIHRLAEWAEKQDRALYVNFKRMKEDVLREVYTASETEMIVIEKFIGNYLEVRLSQCFILEVDKPIMDLIDKFESSQVRVHMLYRSLLGLFKTMLPKFVTSNAMDQAIGNNNLNSDFAMADKLLDIEYELKENQLSSKDLWIGGKAEQLLKELGLTRHSEEVQPWLDINVRGFYEAALDKMVKYFQGTLESKVMEALKVIDPKFWSLGKGDMLRRKFKILAVQWQEVIPGKDIPKLQEEVAAMLHRREEVEGFKEEELDVVFSKVSKMEELENPAFPLLAKLGSSICTIYNSSSPAERDFSLMKTFVGDPNKGNTRTEMLNAKMHIKAEVNSLGRSCTECELNKKKFQRGERKTVSVEHCHCDLWHPSEELLRTVRGGAACTRYRADLKERKAEAAVQSKRLAISKEEEVAKTKKDMKVETEKLRKRSIVRKKQAEEETKKKAEEEAKKKEELERKKQEAAQKKKKKSVAKVVPEKKKSKAAEMREEQRKRLKMT